MASLFEKAVEASGLSVLLASGVLRRACARAGIASPEVSLTRTGLLRALHDIEVALATYLTPLEVQERVADLLRLTRSSSAPFAINLDDESLDE